MSKERLQRRLAAILSADVVGYSRLSFLPASSQFAARQNVLVLLVRGQLAARSPSVHWHGGELFDGLRA
jgi:hypothetical protein